MKTETISDKSKFNPACGDNFDVGRLNSDSKCFYLRAGKSRKLVTNNPNTCNGCVYNPTKQVMIITTDKVYYNGKEFIVNQWPKKRTIGGKTFDGITDSGTYNALKHEYESALTRSIEEGYVVQDDEFLEVIHPVDSLENGFVYLPEPREFECEQKEIPCPDGIEGCEVFHFERTAILLPKKEVKDSVRVEEQVERQENPSVTSPEPSEDFFKTAKDLTDIIERQFATYSTDLTKKLARNAAEAVIGYLNKRYEGGYTEGWNDAVKFLDQPSDKDQSSPAHTDNQEELWNEVSQWFGIETYAASSIRELQNRFTVTRKQK